ncbi:hypothetical protein CRE_21843 [Caenorhabditis remanei]|uniref:Uncharacterized protein n=1 Tax=Caenorhabditis remanei TaxID=31234 RepID=E3MU84_CAERE|nr:hypothetical protein CRE_21843 [Caenorhabditis remanei]
MSSNPQEYVAPGTKESSDFDSSEHIFKCETTNSTTMTTVCRVDRSRSSSGNSAIEYSCRCSSDSSSLGTSSIWDSSKDVTNRCSFVKFDMNYDREMFYYVFSNLEVVYNKFCISIPMLLQYPCNRVRTMEDNTQDPQNETEILALQMVRTLDQTNRILRELLASTHDIEQRVSLVPRLVDRVTLLSNELREFETTSTRLPMIRQPTDIAVQAYEFVIHNRVWSTWVLIDVHEDEDRAIRAFELNGEFFLRKTPQNLGIVVPENVSPESLWLLYHDAILNCAGEELPRPRVYGCRMSHMQLIRPHAFVCGCLPSFVALETHDHVGSCQIRKVAQKALLGFNHELQLNSIEDISSLKWPTA